MKFFSILFVYGSLITFSGCRDRQQTPKDGFTIRGKIAGIHSGGIKLTSRDVADGTAKTIDSAAFSNDSFELKGKLPIPQMMYLVVMPGNWSFQVFVENSDIRVSADTAGTQHFDYTQNGGTVWGIIKKYTIQGSKSQDDWMEYREAVRQPMYDSMYTGVRAAIAALGKEGAAEKDSAERNRLGLLWDSLQQSELSGKLSRIGDYVGKNPSSTAGAYMFYDLYTYSPVLPLPAMDSILHRFTGEARSSSYVRVMLAALDRRKALLPGSLAPDFTLLKRDSSSFTLSATRGKYMMVDFWASWCHPCRQAIPHWKEVYHKYHAKGFDIISVSDDSRWSDWKKAMDQEKMPWTQVCDEFPVKYMPARIGTLYMTSFIPFYVLLDKEGRILEYTNDEDRIDARLAALLGH